MASVAAGVGACLLFAAPAMAAGPGGLGPGGPGPGGFRGGPPGGGLGGRTGATSPTFGAWIDDRGRGEAAAAPPQSLRDALFGGRRSSGGMAPPPPVARYRLDVGESFVIDRTHDEALLKFDSGEEVWALKAVDGAHGDVIFKNDVGEPVLRTTRWGGLTVFTPIRPEGAAASFEGRAADLRASAPIGPQALLTVMTQCSIRAGRAAGRSITFEATGVPPAADWLFADAADLVADAFVRLASEGRRVLLSRFGLVRFRTGAVPEVSARDGAVQITVSPDRGVAGRPSSRRVQLAVAR